MRNLGWCLVIVTVAGSLWAQGPHAPGAQPQPTPGGPVAQPQPTPGGPAASTDGQAGPKEPAKAAEPASAAAGRAAQIAEQVSKAVEPRLQSVEHALAQIANLLRLLIVLAVGLGLLLACQLFRAPAGTVHSVPAAVADEPAERPAPATEQTRGRLGLLGSRGDPDAVERLTTAVRELRSGQESARGDVAGLERQVEGLRHLIASGRERATDLDALPAEAAGAGSAPVRSGDPLGSSTADRDVRASEPTPTERRQPAASSDPRAAQQTEAWQITRDATSAAPPRPQPTPPAPEVQVPEGALNEETLDRVLNQIAGLARGSEPSPAVVAIALLQSVPARVQSILDEGQEAELTPGLMSDLDRALYEPLPAERLPGLANAPESTRARVVHHLERKRGNCIADLSQRQLKRIVATPGDALVPDRIEERRGRERKATGRRELDGKVAAVAPGDGGWVLAGRVIKTVAAQVYEYRPAE